MFTLDQMKAVILENEKLQKEVDSLKEQLNNKQLENVNIWKQRALNAEHQLNLINKSPTIKTIPQEDKWQQITDIVNSDIENVLNVAVNKHMELFGLGLKIAKNEVIDRYFKLDSKGDYIKNS